MGAHKKTVLSTIAALIGAVVCVAVAVKLASVADGLGIADALTDRFGAFGMLVFVILGGLSAVFFFPGSLLMTASGAAFGLGWGFVAALASVCLGAALAFIVARYLARRRVAGWVSKKPRFAAVDAAIGEEGWKLVMLTRCCPIFPYIFQNYAYGLTRVRFSHYVFGSLLGLAPAALLFVYMGSLGRAGTEAVSGSTTSLELAVRVLGFAATVMVAIYITRISTRALERAGL